MKRRFRKNSRSGVALLVVLFVVMAVTVISMRFIARASMVLACGENAVSRCQTDYLAQSALTHAKALIVSPDNATPLGAWAGAGIQIDAESSDYYDLTIFDPVLEVVDPNAADVYSYGIQCSAYILVGGQRTAQTNLDATLRFDTATTTAFYKSIKRN
ncbi:MAG: hypothetical protein KAR47_01060 [Planctomycetes bacterium]|nr:hypothetical protein [Planctomycetota bacterium]